MFCYYTSGYYLNEVAVRDWDLFKPFDFALSNSALACASLVIKKMRLRG